MLRSRADWTGVMEQPSISSGDVGNWCCRRTVAHRRNSVVSGLGWCWSLFELYRMPFWPSCGNIS